MLDVIDARGKRSLEDRDDTCFHLGRHQPGIGPDDADDWNVDAREDIYRRAEQNHGADQKQHQREHDERVRAGKSESYYPHKESSSPCGMRMMLSLFLTSIALQNATTAPRSGHDLRETDVIETKERDKRCCDRLDHAETPRVDWATSVSSTPKDLFRNKLIRRTKRRTEPFGG